MDMKKIAKKKVTMGDIAKLITGSQRAIDFKKQQHA